MALTNITIGSACTGVGMLDEAVRLGCTYFGWRARTAFMCEWESYAAAVLLARMEEASLEPSPIFCGDLADFDARRWRGKLDCFAAGFPCQPWSSAGKQEGTADDRWLWPELARIIAHAQPSLVFLENVPGLVSGGGLHHVLDGFAQMRFDAQWCHCTAEAVKASHRRERLFILAYRNIGHWQRADGRKSFTSPDGRNNSRGSGINVADSGRNGSAARGRRVHGKTTEPQAGVPCNSELRSADVEHSNGQRTRKPVRSSSRQPKQQPRRTSRVGGRSDSVADAECSRSQNECEISAQGRKLDAGDGCPIFAPGPSDFDGWSRVVADGSFDFRAPAIKPGIRVLVDGLALVVDQSRADQLRCAGNGVVAVQGAVAFVELMRRAMSTARK